MVIGGGSCGDGGNEHDGGGGDADSDDGFQDSMS